MIVKFALAETISIKGKIFVTTSKSSLDCATPLYEYVKKDLELSFKKTKSGGFITGDDYGSGGWWKGGVKQAVDEFRKRKGIKLVELCNRQFIFRKA